MSLDLTVTDLFCGAGGASLGLQAAGAVVSQAANHWQRAVETYSTNHQDTRVLCADVSQTDPRRFPKTDILWASPECTTFSQAAPKVRKPNLFDGSNDAYVERSRVTMWDVVRFAELHRYQIVLVENVVDIGRWELIDAWFGAMQKLGYRWKVCSINSMIAHPTPQSRDRWYVVFWREGNRAPDLDIRPKCWCPDCGDVEGVQSWKRSTSRWGKYRQQYIYTCSRCRKQALPYVWPAASAIDWSLPCPRIGDRDRPLAPATRRRIEIGLERYGPAVVQGAGNTYERPGYYRTWPTWTPLPTQTATLQHGVAMPGSFCLSQYDYQGADGNRVYSPHEPVRTIVADGNHQAVVMPGAFFVKNNGDMGEAKYRAHPLSAPLGSIVASSINQSLVVPVHHGTEGPQALPIDAPHRTQTGRAEAALVTTLRNHGCTVPADYPVETVAASGNHHGVIVPAMLVRNYGGIDKAGPMALPLTGPGGTVTGGGNQAVVGVPFVSSYYGRTAPTPVDEPVPTVTGVDRHSLVAPSSIEVDDCRFRMFEPHEAGAAMAFPYTYEVGGTKRDRVRQYGQAVTPPVAEMVLGPCLESLA